MPDRDFASNYVEIDIGNPPRGDFTLARFLFSIFGAFFLGFILPAPLIGQTMLSLGEANTMGPILWVLVCIPPVLFATAFGFFYFRPARRLKKIRTAIYGLSLADIVDRLGPLKQKTRRARGVWLLVNLCLAVAVIIVGAAVLNVFENAACERAYWNGSVWVGSEGGIEYRRTNEEFEALGDSCRDPWPINGRTLPAFFVVFLSGAFALNAFRLWGAKGGVGKTFASYALVGLVWIAYVHAAFLIPTLFGDDLIWTSIIALTLGFYPARALAGRVATWAEPSATEAANRDRRAPILFIRSFADESLTLFEDGGKRIEHVLADAARTYGPFVGIGKPGELRFAGAAREYYDDDSWRPAVLDFMDRSGFVIAIVGVTPGLDWEIRQLLAHDRLSNTIFVFLPYATDSTARFRKFRQLLAGSPEQRGLQQIDLSNARVLHYSRRRGWIAIKSDWVSEGVYQAALDVAVFGLKVDAGQCS